MSLTYDELTERTDRYAKLLEQQPGLLDNIQACVDAAHRAQLYDTPEEFLAIHNEWMRRRNGGSAPWRIDYDNDTGPLDEGFTAWWDVTNGERSFRCTSKADAEWLQSVLVRWQKTVDAFDETRRR